MLLFGEIERVLIACNEFDDDEWRNIPGLVSVVSAVSGASVVFTVSVDGPGFKKMQGIPIVNFAQIILW